MNSTYSKGLPPMNVERWGTGAKGRNHTVARGEMVWSVSNATRPGSPFVEQVEQTLAFLDESLQKAGSSRNQLLTVQVLLSDINERETFDEIWCRWIGNDPERWPQRSVFQSTLAPGLNIEMIITACRESKGRSF